MKTDTTMSPMFLVGLMLTVIFSGQSFGAEARDVYLEDLYSRVDPDVVYFCHLSSSKTIFEKVSFADLSKHPSVKKLLSELATVFPEAAEKNVDGVQEFLQNYLGSGRLTAIGVPLNGTIEHAIFIESTLELSQFCNSFEDVFGDWSREVAVAFLGKDANLVLSTEPAKSSEVMRLKFKVENNPSFELFAFKKKNDLVITSCLELAQKLAESYSQKPKRNLSKNRRFLRVASRIQKGHQDPDFWGYVNPSVIREGWNSNWINYNHLLPLLREKVPVAMDFRQVVGIGIVINLGWDIFAVGEEGEEKESKFLLDAFALSRIPSKDLTAVIDSANEISFPPLGDSTVETCRIMSYDYALVLEGLEKKFTSSQQPETWEEFLSKVEERYKDGFKYKHLYKNILAGSCGRAYIDRPYTQNSRKFNAVDFYECKGNDEALELASKLAASGELRKFPLEKKESENGTWFIQNDATVKSLHKYHEQLGSKTFGLDVCLENRMVFLVKDAWVLGGSLATLKDCIGSDEQNIGFQDLDDLIDRVCLKCDVSSPFFFVMYDQRAWFSEIVKLKFMLERGKKDSLSGRISGAPRTLPLKIAYTTAYRLAFPIVEELGDALITCHVVRDGELRVIFSSMKKDKEAKRYGVGELPSLSGDK